MTTMKNFSAVRRLFFQFFKFGCFTFGGGWSIVAQMQELYVERERSLPAADLLDLTSIGRSLPGTMIGNIAMLYGYRVAGFWGGVACVVGMAIPPAAVLAVITQFYTAFRENLWVAAAMRGVRAAVAPIILGALVNMLGPSAGTFRYPPCVAVGLLTFALYSLWGVNCVWLVVFGVFCGLAICEYYERRGGDAAA